MKKDEQRLEQRVVSSSKTYQSLRPHPSRPATARRRVRAPARAPAVGFAHDTRSPATHWNASESIRAQEAGGRGGKALRSNSTIFPSYIGGRAERARDLNIHGPGTKFKLRPCCRCNHLIRACCRCNRLDVMCFYRQKVIHKNGMNTAADRWLRASTRLNPSCIRGNRGRAVFLDRISRDRRRQSPTPHRPCPSNPVRPVRQDLQVRLVWLYRKAERPDLRSGPSPGQPWLDLWSGGKKRA